MAGFAGGPVTTSFSRPSLEEHLALFRTLPWCISSAKRKDAAGSGFCMCRRCAQARLRQRLLGGGVKNKSEIHPRTPESLVGFESSSAWTFNGTRGVRRVTAKERSAPRCLSDELHSEYGDALSGPVVPLGKAL